MTTLKDTKIRVTVGYSRTLSGTKSGDWHGWQKYDRKLHHVMLINIDSISVLYANLFSVTQELQKGFQVTSEGEIQILRKNSTEVCFDKKMANKVGEGFLLTTKF